MHTKAYEPVFTMLRERAWAHPLTGHDTTKGTSDQIAREHHAALDNGTLRVALTLNR
jgi:hypothetical protein